MLVKCTHKGSRWERGDSYSLYKSNLSRLGSGWEYANKAVTYTWNSYGYRAPEFDTIAWSGCTVVMGCSYVSGTGLTLEDTLPYLLSQRIGPTVNLGYPGSGPDIILDNTIRMIDSGAIPKRVIVIVPELTRLTYYKGKGVVNYLPNQDLDPMYAQWITHSPNAERHGWLKLRSVGGLWASQGVPVSYYERIPIQGYELGPRLPNQVDLARDVHVDTRGHSYAHCGSRTQALWADFIAGCL
jgi:hypothetical protein